MKKKKILALFLGNLVLWTIGYGIMPLLPVQAAGLGASQTMAGACLSLAYLATAAGAVSAGWLSGRFRGRRIPAQVAGLAIIPALWLMGQAATLWSLTVALTMSFFCAGLVLAANSITAGLCANESERGKVFGLLALTTAFGTLLGGGLAGPIVSRWGYATLYAILALIGLLGPLTGLLWEERGAPPAPSPKTAEAGNGAGLGKSFYILFAANLASAVAGFVFFLGRSFVMTDLGFDAAALTTAGAIGCALALPVPLLAGWLSDRLGRKLFMAISFLATTAGLLVLPASTVVWHFWVASMLFTLSNASAPVANALVTDLVPRRSLGRALAISNATTWLGGIVGCVLTGYAAQSLGTTPTLIAGALLSLVAAGLVAVIGQATPEYSAPPYSAPLPSGQPSSAEPLPVRAQAIPAAS
jgi:MFS family permease